MTTIRKLAYFANSVVGVLRDAPKCPNCDEDRLDVLDSKYRVTKLLKCQNCNFQFRWPLDRPGFESWFYERAYAQGMTTEMPSASDLEKLKTIQFTGTQKDFLRYIEILQQCGVQRGQSILDFGCSWGYGTWQLKEAGYNAVGYEVSAPRRQFAMQKLDVKIVDDLDSLVDRDENEKFDCVFSAHVLEHISRPRRTLELLPRLLKPDGFLILITPNGSHSFRQADPTGWHRSWGLVHPNLITNEFYDTQFAQYPRLMFSQCPPRDTIKRLLSTGASHSDSLDGSELFLVVRNCPRRCDQYAPAQETKTSVHDVTKTELV